MNVFVSVYFDEIDETHEVLGVYHSLEAAIESLPKERGGVSYIVDDFRAETVAWSCQDGRGAGIYISEYEIK